MQVFPVYPGKYRVTGWIKCEKLEQTDATVLCEWMSDDNKWMSGDTAGLRHRHHGLEGVRHRRRGPRWCRARSISICLTGDVNNGTVWFDDIAMVRVKSGLPAPQPPLIKAETAPGTEGCLQVTWDPKTLSPGAVRVLVFCEDKPPEASAAARRRSLTAPPAKPPCSH